MWLSKIFKASVIGMLLLLSPAIIKAQGYGDRTGTSGTGGNSSIQGRINFPSNQGATSFRIRLESSNSATLTTLSNSQGIFYFNNLGAGNYTVIVETGDEYEPIRESVTIDIEVIKVGNRTQNLIFELRPKKKFDVKPGVVNASLANVPKPARDQFEKGLDSLNKGDAKAAVKKFEEAVKIYPQFSEAFYELGVAYLKIGDVGKAGEAFKRTLQLNDKNTDAKLNYAIILLNEKKMSESEAILREVVQTEKGSAIPRMYLGISLIGLNRIDEAEQEFLSAINLKDGEKIAQAHRYLGGIYWKKGEYGQAADELEKYVKLAPQAADAEKIRTTIKNLRNMKN